MVKIIKIVKQKKIKRKENVFLENHLKILNYDKTY